MISGNAARKIQDASAVNRGIVVEHNEGGNRMVARNVDCGDKTVVVQNESKSSRALNRGACGSGKSYFSYRLPLGDHIDNVVGRRLIAENHFGACSVWDSGIRIPVGSYTPVRWIGYPLAWLSFRRGYEEMAGAAFSSTESIFIQANGSRAESRLPVVAPWFGLVSLEVGSLGRALGDKAGAAFHSRDSD